MQHKNHNDQNAHAQSLHYDAAGNNRRDCGTGGKNRAEQPTQREAHSADKQGCGQCELHQQREHAENCRAKKGHGPSVAVDSLDERQHQRQEHQRNSNDEGANAADAPAAGVDEDPVTGSAHCLLGPYWSAALRKSHLIGYQASRRGGVVEVEVDGPRTILGGEGVIFAKGQIEGSKQKAQPAEQLTQR